MSETPARAAARPARPGGDRRRPAGRASGAGSRWWRRGPGRAELAPAERPGYFDAPSVVVCPAQVRVGDTWTATLAVTGYPREVGPAWLSPLITHPGLTDVSVHLSPLAPEIAAGRLRRRLARLESGRRIGAARGQLEDADVDASAQDAHVLMAQLARGLTQLFTTTITVTVHASSRAGLAEEIASVRSVAASLMIGLRATTWRSLHAWHTSLPAGLDRLEVGRILDTATLAASFPFAAADLPATRPDPRRGVLYGVNLGAPSLVWWDRWARPNFNEVILGSSGSGKSYFAKSTLLRHLYTGTDAQVIDPDDEYVRLAESIGGAVIRLGAPGVRINPFQLPIFLDPGSGRRIAAPDALARRRLALQSFLAVALTGAAEGADPTTSPGAPGTAGASAGAALSALEKSVLDAAITTVYAERGITDDPRTWTRPAPLLADLHDVLTRTAHPAPDGPGPDGPGAVDDARPGPQGSDGAGVAGVAAGLAARLSPFSHGTHAALFDGATTTAPSGALVVWSLSELPDQVRALAMVLVLDELWRSVAEQPEQRPRLLVIDEAWQMLQRPAAARFVLRAAKSLRKRWAGLSLITQDVADVLASDLGRAVITNSSCAVLLHQSAQALPDLTRAFALSAGEARFLGGAERGEALIVSGPDRVALRAVASSAEDAVITTDPAQLAARPGGDIGPQWIDLDQRPTPPTRTAPATQTSGPGEPAPVPHPAAAPGHPDSPGGSGDLADLSDFDDPAVPGW